MLSVTTWNARSSSASRTCSWYLFHLAAAREASDWASAMRARLFQSPGPVPTADAPHADRADAPDHSDIRIAQRFPHLLAEVLADDLRVLMDDDERLEVLVSGRLLEQEVVAAEDRPGGREGEDLGVGLGDALDPGLRVLPVGVGGGYGRSEGDHRAPLLS